MQHDHDAKAWTEIVQSASIPGIVLKVSSPFKKKKKLYIKYFWFNPGSNEDLGILSFSIVYYNYKLSYKKVKTEKKITFYRE